MMASRLNDAGIGTAFVLPWMSSDADNLTADSLDAIATAAGARKQATLRKAAGTAGSSLAEGWAEVSATDWRLKLLDKTIFGAIRKGTEKIEEWQDGKVLHAIMEYLRGQKLVVFVDDVDRTDPALVPKMLLNLREALSLPNLFYVIGLSPAVVQEGLKEAHPGYSDALRFLEKIVEYPFFLPSLSAVDCARFAQLFTKDDDGIDRDLLASIGSLLPRNPRQLKLFVRTLALLAPQWRRFNRDEISLSAAYLVQLLTLEFPHESRLLANRDQDIEWIEKYHIRQVSQRMNASRGGSNTGAATSDIPATASEIKDESRRTRYVELCSEIGNRLPLTPDYRVRDLLALTHQPPLLTWKEFDGIACEAKAGSVVAVLRRWIDGDDGVSTQERQRVLFRQSVKYRSRVWGAIVDASTHGEITRLLEDLDNAMDLLVAQVRDLRGFENGILSADDWSLLRKHFAETSRFGRPKDLYQARRAAEMQLIAHALDSAPNDVKGDVFLQVRPDDYGFMEKPPAAYTKTIATIRRSCEVSVAETLVARFEKPDGVELLWQQGTPERAVAFDERFTVPHYFPAQVLRCSGARPIRCGYTEQRADVSENGRLRRAEQQLQPAHGCMPETTRRPPIR
jgi:hypothetical protein